MSSAILDTGATASFVAGMSSIATALESSRLSIETSVSTADRNTIVSKSAFVANMHPEKSPNNEINLKLLAIPDRTEIMGHQLILGLDALREFNMKFETLGNIMIAHIDGIEIAREQPLLCNHTLTLINIDNNYKDITEQLVRKFNDVFTEVAESLILTSPMRIPIMQEGGFKAKLRPNSIDKIICIRNQTDKWLERGIIEYSDSPMTSNVHLVPKKSGDLRLVTDFRELNSISVRDSYPLPHISTLFLALYNAKFFAALD